ncbi:polysaccharide deacetylase family protein [Hanstruepera marina]|uniref:polysaccharide deacetylase family protein n=1 Tax=Hanstruepera marina TaxID=2873265 RepID=UPI001CA682FD|nr:polysaccharide deacetylase family protein [Hanstruepera marina]
MLNFKSINIITIVVFIGLLVLFLFYSISPWWFGLLFLIWFSITALGSAIIGLNYHVESLINNPEIQENHIAITFDDGPHPEFTPQVLAILKQYNAKATFFCIGKHVKAYPNVFKQILNEGHTVGNHTYSHNNMFGFFSTKKVITELQQTHKIVNDLTGLSLQLYRPAFGVTNPRIKKAVKTLALYSIGWNKRSFDTTSISKQQILNRITKNLKQGDVILLHDTSLKTVEVLEQLLLFLQHKNLNAVTINELFNIKAYA